MSGSRSGAITQWNDAVGAGLVSENGNGVHVADASDCSNGLLGVLRGKAIPPDKPVPVTFDVDLRNHATNLDLTVTLELAASADVPDMTVEEPESKTRPKKIPPKKAAKKASAKRPAPKKASKSNRDSR